MEPRGVFKKEAAELAASFVCAADSPMCRRRSTGNDSPPRAGRTSGAPRVTAPLIGMVCRVERLRREVGLKLASKTRKEGADPLPAQIGIHTCPGVDIGQPLDKGDREEAKPLK